MSVDDVCRAITLRTRGEGVEFRPVAGGFVAIAPQGMGADGQCDHFVACRGDSMLTAAEGLLRALTG